MRRKRAGEKGTCGMQVALDTPINLALSSDTLSPLGFTRVCHDAWYSCSRRGRAAAHINPPQAGGTQSGFAGNAVAEAACTPASSGYAPQPARKRTPTNTPRFPLQPGRLRREQCAVFGRDGTRPMRSRKWQAFCRDASSSSLPAPAPWARPRGSPPITSKRSAAVCASATVRLQRLVYKN